MSFYEYICFNVCKFTASLTANQFEFIEQLLFKNLMSEQSVCNLMASDVICFTAKLSNSPLCYQYCCVLMNISSNINDTYLPNTTALLNRLIPYLKPQELEYLLKDFDLITHSRIWKLLDVQRVLTTQQIVEYFQKFQSLIQNEKTLTKHDLKILRQLFSTDKLNDTIRENSFLLFLMNFYILKEPLLYSEFIDLLTVLLPNQLNESIIPIINEKLNEIFKEKELDSILIEKIILFVSRLSVIVSIGQSVSAQKCLIKTISSSLKKIYKKNITFYTKYVLLKAMANISMKSKLITIITDCCKDANLKQEFASYLNKVKVNLFFN